MKRWYVAVLSAFAVTACVSTSEPSVVGTWYDTGRGYYIFEADGSVGYNNPDIDWPHANIALPDRRWERRTASTIAIISTARWAPNEPHICIVRLSNDRMTADDGHFDLTRYGVR